jgi:N-glycosidase YbiA
MSIYFYDAKDLYGEFSNFYPSLFTLNGIQYPTSEHYYQAQKFLGPNSTPRSVEYALLIVSQNTPNKAKILAGKKIKGGYQWVQQLNEIIKMYPDVAIRPDWEDVKDNIMRKAIFNKFTQNKNILNLLLSTDDKILAEHTNRDKYWGDGGDGSGVNMLGKILMETRSLLRQDKFWIIKDVLLGDEINVEKFNNLGINFLMDLSGKQIVNNKILGQNLPDNISLYNQKYIFVYGIVDPDILIQAIGKKYKCYIYGYNKDFLTLFFSKLYDISMELAQNLSS